jgi:flagellar assembly protein FliH
MTAPASASKFTFDTVFGEDRAVISERTNKNAKLGFTRDEIESLKTMAYSNGAGDTVARAARDQADALSGIASAVSRALSQLSEPLALHRQECAGLTLAVAKRLAGKALSHFPMAEIETTISDTLHALHAEPRLVIRVQTDLSGPLQAQIAELAEREGFQGRIVITPDTQVHGGDCRIEWAAGGVERNFDAALQRIDEAIKRWLDSSLPAADLE